MILLSYVEQVMTIITSPLMCLADPCPFRNLNTLLNGFMIPHGFLEQIMTICRIQNDNFAFKIFELFHLEFRATILQPFHIFVKLWNIFMILCRYVELVMAIYRMS